jgi:hypothetical protein
MPAEPMRRRASGSSKLASRTRSSRAALLAFITGLALDRSGRDPSSSIQSATQCLQGSANLLRPAHVHAGAGTARPWQKRGVIWRRPCTPSIRAFASGPSTATSTATFARCSRSRRFPAASSACGSSWPRPDPAAVEIVILCSVTHRSEGFQRSF